MEGKQDKEFSQFERYKRSAAQQSRWYQCQEYAKILYRSQYTQPELDYFISTGLAQIAKLNQDRNLPIIQDE